MDALEARDQVSRDTRGERVEKCGLDGFVAGQLGAGRPSRCVAPRPVSTLAAVTPMTQADSDQNGELLLLCQMTESEIKVEAKRMKFHRDKSDHFPKSSRPSSSVGVISQSSLRRPPLCVVTTQPQSPPGSSPVS